MVKVIENEKSLVSKVFDQKYIDKDARHTLIVQLTEQTLENKNFRDNPYCYAIGLGSFPKYNEVAVLSSINEIIVYNPNFFDTAYKLAEAYEKVLSEEFKLRKYY